jgi:hypothetical protein
MQTESSHSLLQNQLVQIGVMVTLQHGMRNVGTTSVMVVMNVLKFVQQMCLNALTAHLCLEIRLLNANFLHAQRKMVAPASRALIVK